MCGREVKVNGINDHLCGVSSVVKVHYHVVGYDIERCPNSCEQSYLLCL